MYSWVRSLVRKEEKIELDISSLGEHFSSLPAPPPLRMVNQTIAISMSKS